MNDLTRDGVKALLSKPVLRKIEFNTGRKYTRDGQVVCAQIRQDSIAFYDKSRLVLGLILRNKISLTETSSAIAWQDEIMQEYDHNRYYSLALCDWQV